MAMWRIVLLAALVAADDVELALEADDCRDGSDAAGRPDHCVLNALQTRGSRRSSDPEEADLEAGLASLGPLDVKAEAAAAAADAQAEGEDEPDLEGRGWWPGGDKLWGSGHGLEDITEEDVGYYDAGMRAAQGRCGDANCALIVNPMHHRTVEQFHIHFFHYQGKYATDLKSKVEKMTCGKSGWHHGHLPCHGSAMFASGFPDVFSLAMEKGSIDHASVIVWPSACGGQGTIIELAYHCSIEHQIRGDFDPHKR